MSDDPQDVEMFEIREKKASCVMSVGRFRDSWTIATHFEYATGNHSGSYGGHGSRPSFTTKREALDEMFRQALKHFSPDAISPADSCANEEQRRLAVVMTAKIQELRDGVSPDGQYSMFTEVLV